jgi:hypothetical protein
MKSMLVLLLNLLAAATLWAQGAPATASGHNQWVASSLKEMQSIKVGMKRVDLEKIFEREGGLGEARHRTYTYRDCPYFKVDVDFSGASSKEAPDDKILSISKPYLAWGTGD